MSLRPDTNPQRIKRLLRIHSKNGYVHEQLQMALRLDEAAQKDQKSTTAIHPPDQKPWPE